MGKQVRIQKSNWLVSEEIKIIISQACQDLGIEIDPKEIYLEHPADETHGDYATNLALAKFSELKDKSEKLKVSNPLELADLISEKLRATNYPPAMPEPSDSRRGELLATVEAKPPGFINFWLKKDYLIELASELSDKEKIKNKLQSVVDGRKTMVIDYSSPNIARPFGIGHLRSTNIGQAIYNIYSVLGWKTIGDNHLGDWGTQFGKLIVAIKKWWSDDLNKLKIADLETLYIKFHQQTEKNPDLENEAREWFKKLEDGDKEAKKIWQVCVDISLKEFDQVYDLLGVDFDESYGESFYHFQSWMKKVIADLEEKGLLKKSRGAKVVDIDGFQTPAMVVKSDGATTYLTRDLAAIKFRKEKWNPDLIIYEVGGEQKFHFQQVFKLAEKIGYLDQDKLVHLAHGLLRMDSGKFSTRKGRTVHLEEVLNEAVNRAKNLVKNSDLTPEEKEQVAQAVGIGGVKFNDLKQEPIKDIFFDWDQILVLEGYSAPYLQYTYARCASVISKSEIRNLKQCPNVQMINKEELALLRTLYQFPEVIISSAENLGPHLVCQYLFDLAQKFNLFYQKHRILDKVREVRKARKIGECDGTKNEVVNFRLFLTKTTASILRTGLEILGIEVLERM